MTSRGTCIKDLLLSSRLKENENVSKYNGEEQIAMGHPIRLLLEGVHILCWDNHGHSMSVDESDVHLNRVPLRILRIHWWAHCLLVYCTGSTSNQSTKKNWWKHTTTPKNKNNFKLIYPRVCLNMIKYIFIQIQIYPQSYYTFEAFCYSFQY